MALKLLLRPVHRLKVICPFPATSTQNSLLKPAIRSNVNFMKQDFSDEKNIPEITYEEIKKLTKNSPQLLIDVREPEELQKTGKIPHSINVPLGQLTQVLEASADKEKFKTKYGHDKPTENSEIIFYCLSGRRARNAADLARTLGYKNTKVYLGSWSEYAKKEGLP